MISKTTLPEIYQPLMGKPSIRKCYCVVCGRNNPLNQHHVVFKSMGEMYDVRDRKLSKPTLTLCGNGNASGCHRLAHERKLHFRYVETNLATDFGMKKRYRYPLCGCPRGGHWEYALFDEGVSYQEALETGDWRRIL